MISKQHISPLVCISLATGISDFNFFNDRINCRERINKKSNKANISFLFQDFTAWLFPMPETIAEITRKREREIHCLICTDIVLGIQHQFFLGTISVQTFAMKRLYFSSKRSFSELNNYGYSVKPEPTLFCLALVYGRLGKN